MKALDIGVLPVGNEDEEVLVGRDADRGFAACLAAY